MADAGNTDVTDITEPQDADTGEGDDEPSAA